MEALAGGGIWLGLIIGFLAGIAFQTARQAVKNLRTANAGMPGLKKTAFGTRVRAAVWLLAVVGYAAIVLVILASTG